MLEAILANNGLRNIKCSNNDFRDLVQNKLETEDQKYFDEVKSIINTLKYVEKEGHLQPASSNAGQKIDSQNQLEKLESKTTVETEPVRSKKKKKKKKNDHKRDQPGSKSTKENTGSDPIVLTLLAMGFSNEQIDAAVLNFGGTEKSTADDMVLWILEREASVSQNSHAQTQEEIDHAEEMQRQAEQQANREAEEAFQKAQEARAAAERLAAKREEQRRIRREWNNKEQLRQQQEAKAKLSEQMERRKKMEIEKASVLAKKVSDEKNAPSALSQFGKLESSTGLESNIIPNTGSLPLFSKRGDVDMDNINQSMKTTVAQPAVSDGGGRKKSQKSKSPKKGKQQKVEVNDIEPENLFQQQQFYQVDSSKFMTPDEKVNFSSNTFGEIRATAREFVPSFTPSLPSKTVEMETDPLSTPPGLSIDNIIQSGQANDEPNDEKPSSVLQPGVNIPSFPRSTTPSAFSIPGIDTSLPGPPGIPLKTNDDITTLTNDIIPGILGEEPSSIDDGFSSSLLSNLRLESESVTKSNALGGLSSVETSTSLSGPTSLWGEPTQSSSKRMSSFGFAQSDSPSGSFAEGDDNKKSNTTSTWGVGFGASGGGSIW